MREKVFPLFSLLLIVGASQATILDQYQEPLGSGGLVVSPDWSVAQTFTAGLTGQLEQVDIYLANAFGTDLHPTTVSIVNTINGVPSGSVLGTIYAENLVEGFNSINFLSKSISLAANTQYGIVLYNEDTERYVGTSTQWCSISTDVYAEGALWIYYEEQWVQEVKPPGDLPVETFYDKDAAFRTWMVPEPATLLLLSLGAIILRRKTK